MVCIPCNVRFFGMTVENQTSFRLSTNALLSLAFQFYPLSAVLCCLETQRSGTHKQSKQKIMELFVKLNYSLCEKNGIWSEAHCGSVYLFVRKLVKSHGKGILVGGWSVQIEAGQLSLMRQFPFRSAEVQGTISLIVFTNTKTHPPP